MQMEMPEIEVNHGTTRKLTKAKFNTKMAYQKMRMLHQNDQIIRRHASVMENLT